MNKIFKDERIEGQIYKFVLHAFVITQLILFISIFTKVFIYDNDVKYYLTELLAVLVGDTYLLIRYVSLGINPINSEKRYMPYLLSSITGIFVTLIALTNNWEGYKKLPNGYYISITMLITFVASFIITFAAIKLSMVIYRKRKKKLEEKYDQ